MGSSSERTEDAIEPNGQRVAGGRRIKAVLFDLDGTLLDTIELILASYHHTLRTCLGRDVEDEWVFARLGDPLVVTMAELCPERVDELIAAYRQYNLSEHDRLTRMFPGVRETLEDLRRLDLRLAVVSSKFKLTVRKGLDLFQLTPFFQEVIGLDECPKHKPDPAPILTALTRLGVGPDEALMVGDSPADVLAARAAGVRAVAVGWSRLDPKLIAEAGPPATISSMPELVQLVTGLG